MTRWKLATMLVSSQQCPYLKRCPNHLVPHWNQEVPGAHVIGFEDAVPPSWLDDSDPACAKTGKIFDDAVRLIIDEPQDVPAGARKNVQVLCESFHKPRWVLCGTAYEAHWEACAQAVMGRALFSALSFRAEQLGRPCVGHFIRHRVVRDLKSKCLPYPPLGIETIPVPLRIHEALDAKVVSLAGFLMDSILFLSYGAKVAAKAVDERQKWLTQMGWRVPATLQVLDGQEWSSIEDLTQSKLKKAKNELELLESHAAIQQSAALKVDIRADRVRVTLIDGNESKVVEAATAEWNWVCCVQARLNLRHGVKVIPDVGSDWAQMTTDAAAEGAVAVMFTTKREELAVMSRTAAAAPTIPAVMVSHNESIGEWSDARIEVLPVEEDEAVWEILKDFTDVDLFGRIQELKQEVESLERALDFATEVGEKAKRGYEDDVCPVCLEPFSFSVAVLPDCFHAVCPSCIRHLNKCPVCRAVAQTDPIILRVGAKEDNSTRTSKESALVDLLNSILAEPNERVVVYTQWVVHVEHLQQVLRSCDIPTLAMCGTFAQRMHALAQFGNPTAPRVLLLSTQLHATGANLQTARHCVIMHPYAMPTSVHFDDETRMQMKAYEKQCLGRVLRFPQKEKVILYRLFARESLEQTLYEELCGAKLAAPLTDASTSPGVSNGDDR